MNGAQATESQTPEQLSGAPALGREHLVDAEFASRAELDFAKDVNVKIDEARSDELARNEQISNNFGLTRKEEFELLRTGQLGSDEDSLEEREAAAEVLDLIANSDPEMVLKTTEVFKDSNE